VYYLFRQTAGTSGALWSRDLESGTSQEVLPGVSMSDFDVSPDQTQVAFTTKTADGSSEVWLARLDRRSPPRSIARGADLVSFAGDDLAFRSLGEKSNSLELIEPDGTGRRRLGDFGVLSLVRPSPDGEWILTFLARGEDTLTVAVPIRGGSPVTICSSLCPASWSADGRFLYVATQFSGRTADSPMMGDPGRTLVIPIPPGRALPDLPADGISFDRAWPGPPGMEIVNRAIITPGPDPKTYVFVANSVQRNLFRLPLR
jgi:Tol biopolymer transport system component